MTLFLISQKCDLLGLLGLLLSERALSNEVEMEAFIGEQSQLRDVPRPMNNGILYISILQKL